MTESVHPETVRRQRAVAREKGDGERSPIHCPAPPLGVASRARPFPHAFSGPSPPEPAPQPAARRCTLLPPLHPDPRQGAAAACAVRRRMRAGASSRRPLPRPRPEWEFSPAPSCPQDGYTAFIRAAGGGHLEIVRLLMDTGVDVNHAAQANPADTRPRSRALARTITRSFRERLRAKVFSP